MTSTAVSAEDQSLFRWLAGGRLLIAIIFLGTAVLFIVLWAKRQILRLFLINRKGPLDNPGNNAPRHLKKEIEENFNKIAAMRIEAKLLCDQSDAHVSMYTSFVEERDDSTYKYRRKAFDLMSCLDELLSRVNIGLARKPSQNVRDHLMLLQGPPYSPFEGHSDLCENVTHLYEHARYGAKEFTAAHYNEYSTGIDLLYNRVHQKFLIPGSLLVNSEYHQQMQESEYSAIDESESLLILPSILIEDKNMGVRNRDSFKGPIP